jgi:hypothetical protein
MTLVGTFGRAVVTCARAIDPRGVSFCTDDHITFDEEGFVMTLDRSFVELNRASTARIRALAVRLSDVELQHPVGQHWTVAIVFAHLAFWDRRVLYVLDMTERDGKLFIPEIGIFVNDLSLPQ